MFLGIFSYQLKTQGDGRSSRCVLHLNREERGGCGGLRICGRVSRHLKLKPAMRWRGVRQRVAEAARSSRQAKDKERGLEELPGEPVGRKRWRAM